MSKVKDSTQALLDSFLASLPTLSSFEAIEKASTQLREQLDKDYSESTLGTILSKSGFYKRLRTIPLVEGKNAHQFTKQNGEVVLRHYCLNFLEPDWDKRNQSTRITERLDNKKPIYPHRFAEVVKRLLVSSNYVELAIALIASTGRRPIEIVKTGNFRRVEGEDFQVTFTGQAKKRGVKTQFNISTLFPSPTIIRALRRLRLMPESKKYKAMTNDEIDNTINRQIRKLIPELFEEVLEVREGGSQINNDILRSVSALLLCTRDCPKSKDELKWVGEFLGHLQGEHSEDSDTQLNHLLTTLGYNSYYVEGDVPFYSSIEDDKPKSIRIYEDDLNLIKAFQEKYDLPSHHEALSRLLDLAFEALEERESAESSSTDFSELSSEQLKEGKIKFTPNSATERIARAVTAIMNYNDFQAPSNDDRWAITVRSIKDLCGSRHEAIKKFLEEHQVMVDDHNNKYDLSLYHNQRHGRKKVRISDLIDW